MYLYLLKTRKRPALNRTPVIVPNKDVLLPINGRVLAIEPPPVGERARKVVTRSGCRMTGKYPSWKMQRMIQWESEDERNVFRMLDVSSDCVSFQEQPLTIAYEINGEKHRHIPDVLVHTSTGKELWEIKTSYNANKADVRERTALLAAALPAHGYRYKMVLADVLRNSVQLRNAAYLLDWQQEVPSSHREALLRFCEKAAELTFGHIESAFNRTNTRAYVCRMIIEGALHINFDQELNNAAKITLADQAIGGGHP